MKNVYITLAMTMGSSGLFAQVIPDTAIDKSVKLNEVIISANKVEESKKNVAQHVQVITAAAIQNTQAMTTAEVISAAGIPVQKSQLGGGSPMLRGFEASRIGLVIDGVRLNNLIYRSGHLQDIVKTDQSILDRVEILYGPSSTIYGSDALGGVIHLYTKRPLFAIDDQKSVFKLNVVSRFQSACKGLSEHFNFNFGSKRLASLTAVTYNKYGDLMGGRNQNPFYDSTYGERKYYVEHIGIMNGSVKDSIMKNKNRYLQVGSGYSQYDILQKFAFKQNDKITHGLNFQYSNSTNVPRYDRLTDPNGMAGTSAEWYYGPQMRLLAAYDMNVKNHNAFFQNIHVGVNYQALQESRHNRNFGSRFLTHRIEDVGVIGGNIDVNRTTEKHNIRFGFDLQLNKLKSTAERYDIVADTGSIGNWDSRYPDGDNKMNNFALYFSHTWKLTDKLVLTDGIRIGYSSMYSTLIDTAIMFSLPYTTIEQKTPVYSGTIGLIHSPSDDLKLSLLWSTGFRVPNVDDMSKIFGSAPGMVIVPNVDLKPEKTYNYELGVTKIFSGNTRWENSIFYTEFRDVAVIAEYTFNGKDSLLYDGSMAKVYANQNRDHAYIYGISSNLVSQMDNDFRLSVGFNYTYGRVQTDTSNTPLDHVPPFNARTSLMYMNGKFTSELFVLYNGWKKLKDFGAGEDNFQYATPEGMPAWFTLNMRMNYQIHKFVTIQAGIDNMFDTQYRTFASGINAPGRNFIVALRAHF